MAGRHSYAPELAIGDALKAATDISSIGKIQGEMLETERKRIDDGHATLVKALRDLEEYGRFHDPVVRKKAMDALKAVGEWSV